MESSCRLQSDYDALYEVRFRFLASVASLCMRYCKGRVAPPGTAMT